MTRCVHYVGFVDDRFSNARRVFGGPVIIHRRWDQRAFREIGEDDIVVFANGDWKSQVISKYNGSDIEENDQAKFDN